MLSSLELKIPPVAVVAIFAAFMTVVSWQFPSLSWPFPGRLYMSVILLLLGGAFSLAGVISFRQHRTTVNPMMPTEASTFVSTGVYQITRNPMYAGFVLGLTGWAIFLSNFGAISLVFACVLYLTRFQIKPEEQALLKIFGMPFANYMASVRRWI